MVAHSPTLDWLKYDQINMKIKNRYNGIIKKTAKTPKSAIDLAKKYKTDYEWRHRNEQL